MNAIEQFYFIFHNSCYNVDFSKGVHSKHEMNYYLAIDPEWNSVP